MKEEEVLAVLEKHFLCVISTVTSDGLPEAAIVGYEHSDSLELLIGTSQKSRKYANLVHNSNVAITIGDTDAEVQYEGTARVLDASEVDSLVGASFTKLPGVPKYQNDPDQRWLLVTPSWLRLTIHGEEDRVEEMRQFA